MYDEDLINRSESLLIVAILVFTKYALVEFGIHSKEIGAPKCGMRPILKYSIHRGITLNCLLTEEGLGIVN